jgi:hypothetical protein
MCWVSDAGHERSCQVGSGRRPKAAKERSRGKCGTRQGSKRYEDCKLAPLSMVSATPARGDVHVCMPENQRDAVDISAGTWSASTGGWWIDGWHRFERRQPAAAQNASTTSTFRHEC